jgi:hypothetical protein
MQADVLFVADHFVMVTTIEVDYSPDQREVEKQAWDRLGAEYGIDWVGMTQQFIKNVSIEVMRDIPTIGDITDTGTEGENNEEQKQ